MKWPISLALASLILPVCAQTVPEPRDLLAHSDDPLVAAQTLRIEGTHVLDFNPGGMPIHNTSSFSVESQGLKVRYQSKEGNFSTLEVFDGSDTWGYKSLNNTYTKSPGRHVALANAGLDYLVYGRNPANLVSATMDGEEQIPFGGAPVRCYIVVAAYKGIPSNPNVSAARKVWISADRGLVLRDNWVAQFIFANRPTKSDNTFTYTTLEWGISLADERFRFEPPAGSGLEGAPGSLTFTSIGPYTAPLSNLERAVGISRRPGAGRWTWIDSARLLIQQAFQLKSTGLPDLPDWAKNDFYDIELTSTGNAAADVIRQTKQAIIEDQFKLKFHRETRTLPAYLLTVAPGGFKGPKPGPCMPSTPTMPYFPTAPNSAPTCGKILPMYVQPESRLQGGSVTMADFTDSIADLADHPVIDRTGITSKFDVYLPVHMGRDIPFLTKMLEERFGLKLDLGEGPVEVMVVDHLERPPAQ